MYFFCRDDQGRGIGDDLHPVREELCVLPASGFPVFLYRSGKENIHYRSNRQGNSSISYTWLVFIISKNYQTTIKVNKLFNLPSNQTLKRCKTII